MLESASATDHIRLTLARERVAELEAALHESYHVIGQVRGEVKRLREACELVYTRVQRIQQQGRIVVPAALWILDRLRAALEPTAKEKHK